VLSQFTFAEFRELGPHVKPGTGTIYYSPSYVRHLLANAENIAKCDPSAFAKPLIRLPGAATRQAAESTSLESLPAELRPSDLNNLYALCMDHEMPPDAVMIKATWSPVFKSPKGTTDIAMEPYFDTSAAMASKLYTGSAGQWIEEPSPLEAGGMDVGSGFFKITDEQGKEWVLMGMHIASKTLRTWMWISLFPSPGYDWRADKPDLSPWSLYHYQMCTVSDFKEGDAAPWIAYDGKGDPHFQVQADAIKAVAKVMNGTQWCANPYIETNMARGNCIGCHQGSTESFLPKVISRERQFNISDFSFSFATNRANIIKLRQQHAAQERLTTTKSN